MGRSRGGLTTKIHVLVDANGLPVALELSEGQAHDGKSAKNLLARLEPGQILLADRAYDSDALRQGVASQGAWANIKPMPGRVRIRAFSAWIRAGPFCPILPFWLQRGLASVVEPNITDYFPIR